MLQGVEQLADAVQVTMGPKVFDSSPFCYSVQVERLPCSLKVSQLQIQVKEASGIVILVPIAGCRHLQELCLLLARKIAEFQYEQKLGFHVALFGHNTAEARMFKGGF